MTVNLDFTANHPPHPPTHPAECFGPPAQKPCKSLPWTACCARVATHCAHPPTRPAECFSSPAQKPCKSLPWTTCCARSVCRHTMQKQKNAFNTAFLALLFNAGFTVFMLFSSASLLRLPPQIKPLLGNSGTEQYLCTGR